MAREGPVPGETVKVSKDLWGTLKRELLAKVKEAKSPEDKVYLEVLLKMVEMEMA